MPAKLKLTYALVDEICVRLQTTIVISHHHSKGAQGLKSAIGRGSGSVFRGADDPLKLKGVKFTKGYCSVVWFEELDQFEGVEAVRSILNSLRRGGDRFWIFYSYNPPKTMWSWVNVERLERKRRDDTLVCGSSYLDVIKSHPEWLAGLREIVIDPDRCPLTFSEFTLKEFERDKEGNWIDDIPDGNDHSIDAV